MINSKMNGIMVRIRVLIEDQEGKELTRLQSMNLELGSQSLAEIEKAVEKLKQKMLPEISSHLLTKAQREFTEEKKKT
jgi:predicted translin family RNA/ssDNA-binding protein